MAPAMISDSGFQVSSFRFQVSGLGSRDELLGAGNELGLWIPGFKFRILGFGLRD